MIKYIISYHARTWAAIVTAYTALKKRYPTMVVSYKHRNIGCNLFTGKLTIQYP